MTHIRRRTLALAGAGLAALAGCTGGGSNGGPSNDDEPTTNQVPTSDTGVTVRVVNRSMAIRSVRVAGVGDGTTVSLSPGSSFDAGIMYAPVDGQLTYDLAVFADGERVGERSVTLSPTVDLRRLDAELTGDGLEWTEATTEA